MQIFLDCANKLWLSYYVIMASSSIKVPGFIDVD